MEGVEDDVLNKARYYGARAADKAISNQENKDALVVGLALSELDKLLSTKDENSMVRPLLVKAEVLRKVGDPRKAMSILQQVQKLYKDAERNTEFMMSLLSKAAHARPTSGEADSVRKNLEKMKGALLIIGAPDEKRNLFDMQL
jgi:tetratricopeptide (TPR) repeat protein